MPSRKRFCSRRTLPFSLTITICSLPALASSGGSSVGPAPDEVGSNPAEKSSLASADAPAVVRDEVTEPSTALLQAAAPQEVKGWHFALKPYLWFAGIDADVQIGSLPEVSGDASFSEIVEDLDFAAMMGFDMGRRGERWSLAFDGIYMHLTPKDDQVEVTQSLTMIDACFAYQVGQGSNMVELLGGVRGVDSSLEVTLANGSNQSRDKGWLEPLIGARCSVPLNDKISLRVRGDVSGFGVGSDLTWQALGVFTYQFSEGFYAGLGYRHMEIDYSEDNFDLDLALDGPILGLQFNI